jgi:predicted transcriptional regulator
MQTISVNYSGDFGYQGLAFHVFNHFRKSSEEVVVDTYQKAADLAQRDISIQNDISEGIDKALNRTSAKGDPHDWVSPSTVSKFLRSEPAQKFVEALKADQEDTAQSPKTAQKIIKLTQAQAHILMTFMDSVIKFAKDTDPNKVNEDLNKIDHTTETRKNLEGFEDFDEANDYEFKLKVAGAQFSKKVTGDRVSYKIHDSFRKEHLKYTIQAGKSKISRYSTDKAAKTNHGYVVKLNEDKNPRINTL